jgi:hypothetical protein
MSVQTASTAAADEHSRDHALIAFTPAGKMQRFFEVLTSSGNTRQDAEFLREHDIEFIGPPLPV